MVFVDFYKSAWQKHSLIIVFKLASAYNLQLTEVFLLK